MSEVYIREESGLKLDRANKLLAGIGDGKPLRNALYNALNRAAISARKKAATFATERYVISSSTFKSHVKEKYHIHYGGGKLTGGVVSAEITFAGNVIKLSQFGIRASKDGGISVNVKRGGGGAITHGFIPENMRFGVFERTGSSRLPIEEKYGPSAAHMMMDEEVTQKMEQQIVTTFNSRIDQEIDRILNGW